MKGLQFQRLVLLSDSKRLANQFEFPKRLNLVTGSDNSIGKSTLVKSLYWALGCDPYFDNEWKSHDVKTILYFKVDEECYLISRYQDAIYFGKDGEALTQYQKITGDFSRDFAKIVGFELLLENRQEGLDIPPPAFYFLPFYIDQKKSWDEPWNGFDKLSQYSRFKPNLIKYFCGYLTSEHFELEEDVFEQKAIEKEASHQVERLSAAIDVLEEVNNETSIAITQVEFEKIQLEIELELQEFTQQQTQLFEQQSLLKNEIYDLEQQYAIATTSAQELEEDYIFTVENVQGNILECPLCGVEHDNSFLNRAGLLTDKESLEQQSVRLKTSLTQIYSQLGELDEELKFISSEVDRINNKYIQDKDESEDENKNHFNQALNSIAQKNVNNNVIKSKELHQLKCSNAKNEQKKLKKDQKKLLTAQEKKNLDDLFMGNLIENIKKLSAKGVNLNGVKSPNDYKKLLGGGAAEGTRGILAYQLAILRQIEYVNHCALAPVVLDTPNQQEQAEHRYQVVVDVIKENIPSHYQIILCGMENEALDLFKQEAHVINLSNNRLLQPELYESLRKEYEGKILTV